jgi:hypothetical protein
MTKVALAAALYDGASNPASARLELRCLSIMG